MSTNFSTPPEWKGTIYLVMNIRPGHSFGEVTAWDCDMSSEDSILLGEHEMTLAIDTTVDIKSVAIKSLEATKQRVQAEAFKKTTEIQAKIDDLLAIEYRPSTEEGNEPIIDEMPF